MAITVTKASYPRTVYRLLVLLGFQNRDIGGFVPTVNPGSPFSLEDCQEAVMQADLKIAQDICNLAAHPYKTAFFTETPITLSYGDKIPAAIGEHNEVKITSAAGPTEKGRLAKNYQHLKDAIAFPDVYGDAKFLYWIEHGIIYFNGTSAKVYSPTIDLNRTTVASLGFLMCPDAYANGIIAEALQMLLQRGGDSSMVKHYEGQAEKFRARMIVKKALDLPEVESFQKLD
jgi:hypothetical protein